MLFRQLLDPETSTYTYLLADEESKEAVLIDPVKEQVDRDMALLDELGLKLKFAVDTHVHADHVTGAGLLRHKLGAKTVVSRHAGVACADVTVDDGDQLEFGRYRLEVRTTPGHTNGCVTYVTDNKKMAFTGDALLIRGSGRTDFQQGDPRILFDSVRNKIFNLPDDAKLYPGHDYQGREFTTVAEEKHDNPRLGLDKSVDDFVGIMENLNLPYPKKIDVAVPANLFCGLPPQEEADVEYAETHEPLPIHRTLSGIPEVTPEFVQNLPRGVRLVDVRNESELVSDGFIQGQEHIPLGQLQDAVKDWSRERPVVVYCRSGGRSGQAAKIMEGMGFKCVASMAGGMLRWSAERRPVAWRN